MAIATRGAPGGAVNARGAVRAPITIPGCGVRRERAAAEAIVITERPGAPISGVRTVRRQVFRVARLFAAVLPLTGAAKQPGDGNTSPPQVIVPQMTPAPQTPAYPSPPIGTESPGAPITPTLRGARVVAPTHGSAVRDWR